MRGFQREVSGKKKKKNFSDFILLCTFIAFSSLLQVVPDLKQLQSRMWLWKYGRNKVRLWDEKLVSASTL